MNRIGLEGSWQLKWTGDETGEKYTIRLPGTLSDNRIARTLPDEEKEAGYLKDPYHCEGGIEVSRMLPKATSGKRIFLRLERTRMTQVLVDERPAGCGESLTTPQEFELTDYVKDGEEHLLTVCINNTSYPIPGGHMTSPDTQTNWLGITGEISIREMLPVIVQDLRILPDAGNHCVRVSGSLDGPYEEAELFLSADEGERLPVRIGGGSFDEILDLPENAPTWDEWEPHLHTLNVIVCYRGEEDVIRKDFGLRDLRTEDGRILLNGERIFLRGKHDGMIFPMTGYAPTDKASWKKVLSTAASYGINHYRFHTCCPPEAAFEAADELGIYLEPELPFWGTVHAPEEADEAELRGQAYLIREGFRILAAYGHHPSFFMLSLGNELWGSIERLNEILKGFKALYPMVLYTQGSNNFQFVPQAAPDEDVFAGVRFSRERLFRGSYAMCDAPQGFIQTQAPTFDVDYDGMILPEAGQEDASSEGAGEILIQYGTGVRKVRSSSAEEMIPRIPVISHEIGQYCMYPDYEGLKKYTGVLKPYNFEIFKQRLAEAGLSDLAASYAAASGALSVACYKEELEAALKSNLLSGFQLLDLQDFTGQGTATVGILDAFMESKGLITPKEWRSFCASTVILCRLRSLTPDLGEKTQARVQLYTYEKYPLEGGELSVYLENEKGERRIFQEEIAGSFRRGVFDITDLEIPLTEEDAGRHLKLRLLFTSKDTQAENVYDLYPVRAVREKYPQGALLTGDVQTAVDALKAGKDVLLVRECAAEKGMDISYESDFWNYPMFRSISDSMNRPRPVGTLGLLIDREHPAMRDFASESYSTPQWYDIVTAGRGFFLKGTNLCPICRIIDNVERNNNAALLAEGRWKQEGTQGGRLILLSCNEGQINESAAGRWLVESLLSYLASAPKEIKGSIDEAELRSMF